MTLVISAPVAVFWPRLRRTTSAQKINAPSPERPILSVEMFEGTGISCDGPSAVVEESEVKGWDGSDLVLER